jgi:hypothetical protein
MMKTCIKCGRMIPASMGSRCEDHPNRWRSGSTREWRKKRARILARDGTAAQSTFDRVSAVQLPTYSRFTT